MILFLFILAIYTSVTQETTTVIVSSPSLSVYDDLYNRYSVSLECSCKNIATKYDRFITQIEPHYHPICSSIFVTSNWTQVLHAMATESNNYFEDFVENDYRLYVKAQFETIVQFCRLSKKIFDSSVMSWQQTDFVTAHLISRTEFDAQINSLIEEFKRKTSSQFMQTFRLIQVINHANQLATTQTSNWLFYSYALYNLSPNYESSILNLFDINIAHNALQTFIYSKTYDNKRCSCAMQSDCSVLSIYPHRTSNQSFYQTLPGYRIGCLHLDALFKSSFSCLYNRTCLDLLQAGIYYSKPVSLSILADTSFPPNTTIETFFSQIFVTQWSEQRSFHIYFDSCAPDFCQYKYNVKFNRIYFLTALIAVFGGLTKGLHIVLSFLAAIVYRLYDRRKRNQIASCSQQTNIHISDSADENINSPRTEIQM